MGTGRKDVSLIRGESQVFAGNARRFFRPNERGEVVIMYLQHRRIRGFSKRVFILTIGLFGGQKFSVQRLSAGGPQKQEAVPLTVWGEPARRTGVNLKKVLSAEGEKIS